MNDNVIDATEAAEAENWLLPEVSGSHLVGASSRDTQAAGFNLGAATRQVHKKKSLRALSENDLKLLEAEVRAAAYQEGRSEGYETGYREGEQRATTQVEENARKTLANQQATLATMIDAIMQPLGQQSEDYKTLLAELVTETAAVICQRELQIDNSSIVRIVSDAVDAIPLGEKSIRLHLHPIDLATLQSMAQFVKPGWQLLGDEQLQQGDCFIETENSVVDFSRSARLRQILQEWLNLSDAEVLAGAAAGAGMTADIAETSLPDTTNKSDDGE